MREAEEAAKARSYAPVRLRVHFPAGCMISSSSTSRSAAAPAAAVAPTAAVAEGVEAYETGEVDGSSNKEPVLLQAAFHATDTMRQVSNAACSLQFMHTVFMLCRLPFRA